MHNEEDLLFSQVEPAWPDAAPELPGEAEHLTISQVQREFGLTQRALRFYETKGLISPRRAGAVRLYGRRDRARLAQILRAKRLGFTLCEIRQMLESSNASAGLETLSISRRQCFDQIKHLEQRRREIDSALNDLRKIYSSFYARLVTGRS
jgi:DNA-binding transcriptional MerR regulator